MYHPIFGKSEQDPHVITKIEATATFRKVVGLLNEARDLKASLRDLPSTDTTLWVTSLLDNREVELTKKAKTLITIITKAE